MANPLLAADGLPDYAAIRAEHAEPAVRAQLAANRARLAKLLRAELERECERLRLVKDSSDHHIFIRLQRHLPTEFGKHSRRALCEHHPQRRLAEVGEQQDDRLLVRVGGSADRMAPESEQAKADADAKAKASS